MKSLFTLLIGFLAASTASANEIPRPLVELLFGGQMENTGTLGGQGRVEEYAPGEGPAFGPGLRGMGLDLTRSSRGGGGSRGGTEHTQAGGSVKLDGAGIEPLSRMTLAVWFNPSGPNVLARLLFFGPSWDLYLGSRTLGFKTRNGDTDHSHATPGDELLPVEGKWNFVAVTFDDETGEGRCYHGLKGGQLRHICTWQKVPKLDRGPADLEIGNLSGIRPFRGSIDSVRLFDRVLTAGEVEAVYAMDSRPKMSLAGRARCIPARPSLFEHGDVCLSSRSIRPNSIETIKAFGANRLTWSYSANSDFIQKCKEAGAATYQAAINSLPGHGNTEAHCLNLEGQPMVAPWMVAFNRDEPVYWGCNNRAEFLETSVERATQAIDAGADWIQFDDWALITSAARWGGACFCDDCMAGFRDHLKTHLSVEELAGLGIAKIDAFDYRRHLAEAEEIVDAETYRAKRRSLPLSVHFDDFQRRSVRRFFSVLRERIDAHAGRAVGLSINSTFLRPEQSNNFLADIVDVLQGETWSFDLANLTIASKTAEGLGKWQVFVPKPRDMRQMRQGVAAAYAMGQLMLVPWDMYMGSDATGIQPRYYGTVEEYGDLYHFIGENASLLDGYRNPACVGVIVDLDHFDRGRVATLCRRLFESQTPFTFVPMGQSYYECGLNAERLKGLEILLLAAEVDAMAEADRMAIQAAAAETPVLADRDASAELLASESPFEVWGPRGIFILPRARPDADEPTLVCHVLNRVEGDDARELKWVSFLVKRWAFDGRKLAAVRWHTPGEEPLELEFERLASGARIIIPSLPIWGIAELRFENRAAKE